MPEQSSIPTNALSRMAAIAGAGTKVGVNFVRHYAQAAVSGRLNQDALDAANARDIYKTLSELKGGPLKIAQMLSTDQHLLPAAYADVFSQAQYSAPPLSYPLVARTFRREFGREPLEFFDEFSREAVAGASIGQVHKARRGNLCFAVKVQYPGIADSLRSDLAVVKPLALRLFGLREEDVSDYFREVEERLMEETDYEHELERSLELTGQCACLAGVRFPKFFREYSSRRILTSEWIDGVPFDAYCDGNASQKERDRIGQALWDFYDFQIHELKRFHADPHPGNFLVSDGKLVPLDFGCTKQLDPHFHKRHFAFLDERLLEDDASLERALRELRILLPEDGSAQTRNMLDLCRRSIALLARPFHEGEFNFGDPEYLREIRYLGEQSEREGYGPKMLRGARGSAESLYVNRAYFGLYNLLARLRARVMTVSRFSVANGQSNPVAGGVG